MHDFSSNSAVSQSCPRTAARLLREWLPGWSGSVVIHGTAVCCFVAVGEYGPQLWPVTRGRSSAASAPAMDSRAGGLLARMEKQTPPLRIESIEVPEDPAVDQSEADPLTVIEVVRNSVQKSSQEEIKHLTPILVNERPRVLAKSMTAEEPLVALRVDPATLRDEELLRPIKAQPLETDTPSEEKSENGSSAAQGNAAEDSVASTASAASNGAEDTQLPQPVATNVAPTYPEEARAAGVQGKVILRLRIGVDGRVESLRILTSSGVQSLDDSALAAVKQWRFEPARRLGRPTAMDVKTTVSFQIEAQ